MDYALRLEEPGPLPADPRQWCAAAWGDALPEGRLAALYFGSEFCEERLPGPAEAEAFCGLARERGLEAVLLTPVVRARGLGRVDRLLAALAGRGRHPAVVCNDWGVWRLVQAEHPACPRRGGRLLNLGLRDPRALPAVAGSGGAPPAAGGERSRLLRELLRQGGAVGIETDPDLEGGFLGAGGDGLERTLHLPFAFATSGRHCLVKAAAGPGQGAYARGLAAPCGGPCREGPSAERRDDTPVPLWRAGNTLFYEVPGPLAEAHLARADRVVLHRRPAP